MLIFCHWGEVGPVLAVDSGAAGPPEEDIPSRLLCRRHTRSQQNRHDDSIEHTVAT